MSTRDPAIIPFIPHIAADRQTVHSASDIDLPWRSGHPPHLIG